MIKILCLLFLVTSCGKPVQEEKEPVKETYESSPIAEEIILDSKMSLNFALLPLKGEVKKDKKLWSGDGWRLNRGAINYRWNAKEKLGMNYASPTAREIATYPSELLNTLSPSEKYDIYMGRYDYPLKNEVDWLARSGKMEWEGLCHGWAGASMNHPEPGPVTVTNPDGIEVQFGSSDIKALLTYAYSKMIIRPEESTGKRCEYYSLLDDEDLCDDDVTALTFHAVLANKIGLRGQSFIADMDRYKEVWNHPVVSYESTILSTTNFAKGRRVLIETKITYIDIMEKNSWEKLNTQMFSYMTVKYELSMDGRGNMVSSRWISRDRPDFLWSVSVPEKFDGYLESLINLI
jgi:hypothetical protein